jgi:diguanylate cyclase (GGDEF)-like protein
MLQYLGVVFYALSSGHLETQGEQALRYGTFDWNDQLGRLLLLGTATLVAAATIGRSRRLRYLSIRDGLTGLFNRTFLDERLEDEMVRAHRGSNSLAVAMLDIDHFKRFNDSHGHQAGDQALRILAETLRRSLRATDIVARYGGEEFVVVFTGVTEEVALGRLEYLRKSIATLEMLEDRAEVRLTVSAGLALWPRDGMSVDEILLCADERLYRAKRLGRNRVVGPGHEADPTPLSASGGGSEG